MAKKISIAVAVLLVGFFIYVAVQPAEMFISREIVINAPAEAIFPYINSTKKSDEWMPWRDIDPTVTTQYSGPEEGVGAKSSWDSKGQMGTGEALVVESNANQSVKTQLTYTKPMQMTQLAEMSLAPSPAGTLVRWSVSGKNSFIGRIMCVFMNMDKEVGGHFEKGLATLKSKVEQPQ